MWQGAEGPAVQLGDIERLEASMPGRGVGCLLTCMQSMVPGREVIGQIAFSNHLSHPPSQHLWAQVEALAKGAKTRKGKQAVISKQRGLPRWKGALRRPLHTPVHLTGHWSEVCLWPSSRLPSPSLACSLWKP